MSTSMSTTTETNTNTQQTQRRTTFIPHFRTAPSGSWRRPSGQSRGWWRVLEVFDPAGSLNRRSKNVVRVVWEGREGIRGVTQRSRFFLGADEAAAQRLADALNRGEDESHALDEMFD